MSEDQDKFIKQARQQLDQQVDELDGETLSRLRQARARALEAGKSKGVGWFGLGEMAGGAMALASVCVIAVAVWLAVPMFEEPDLVVHTSSNEETQLQVLDDLELLADAQEPEFYEDIEFYYWLETQDAQG